MTDTTETTSAVKTVATEIGKAAAKATVQTAVEMAAAITVLAAAGFVTQKVQERRARKAVTQPAE